MIALNAYDLATLRVALAVTALPTETRTVLQGIALEWSRPAPRIIASDGVRMFVGTLPEVDPIPPDLLVRVLDPATERPVRTLPASWTAGELDPSDLTLRGLDRRGSRAGVLRLDPITEARFPNWEHLVRKALQEATLPGTVQITVDADLLHPWAKAAGRGPGGTYPLTLRPTASGTVLVRLDALPTPHAGLVMEMRPTDDRGDIAERHRELTTPTNPEVTA